MNIREGFLRVFAALAALLFVFTAARAQAAEPLASVPYRIAFNGWYAVDVTVNGEGPYSFIVDTGATLTAVFENITFYQSFAPADGAERRVLGVTGAQNLPAALIGDIDVGGLHLKNHIGVIIPNWEGPGPKPYGVLGLDFLSRYIVFFNTAEKRIEFYDPNNPPTDIMRDMTRTRLRYSKFNQQERGLYNITLKIAGRRIPCIFDLGAVGTMINYRAMRRLLGGVYIDAPRATGVTTGSKIRDVFGDEDIARAFRAGPIKVGRATWGTRVLIVYNAGIFQDLGLYNKSYGLLGSDLLRDRNFIIDFADERFYVTKYPLTGKPR